MGEKKNWFARNRGFVFGFAVAIAILNILVLILLPQQTPIHIDQTVAEYDANDESFSAEHTFTLTGTLTKSVLAKPSFTGTLCISGLDGLDEPVTLRLERKDGRWEAWVLDAVGQTLGLPDFGLASFDADKTLDDLLVFLFPMSGGRFLAPGAVNRHVALARLYDYYPALRTK